MLTGQADHGKGSCIPTYPDGNVDFLPTQTLSLVTLPALAEHQSLKACGTASMDTCVSEPEHHIWSVQNMCYHQCNCFSCCTRWWLDVYLDAAEPVLVLHPGFVPRVLRMVPHVTPKM